MFRPEGTSRRRFLAGAAGLVGGGVVAATAPRLLLSPAAAAATRPTINPRRAWGEDLQPTGPLSSELPGDVKFLLVHHTASANGYSPAAVRSTLRAVYAHHTGPKGWNDVAYNFLVDSYGGIWEGRQGSLDGPVKGDATGGSQGYAQLCCFIGDHQTTPPPAAAVSSMAALLAWLAGRYGIDLRPGATATFVSRGTNRHPAGTLITTSTIAGHRDMSATGCPGDAGYRVVKGELSEMAARLAGVAATSPVLMRGAAPVLVQSRFGRVGNFELAYPSSGGGIAVMWRDNDAAGMPWRAPSVFGSSLGRVDALSMIQSTYDNLEVVARVGEDLYSFWRDSRTFAWNGPHPLAGGAAGNPLLVQSRFGVRGNFELVYPASAGGILVMWRNNDVAGTPWSVQALFGSSLGRVDAVSMIQSSYGNLEVVARVGQDLYTFWRDSTSTAWHGPSPLVAGAAGNPVLVQSRFGQQGNFELVYPASAGGIRVMWRDNDAAGHPWSAPSLFGPSQSAVDGVSMIQSSWGNLEVVARVGANLYSFWRDSTTFAWSGPAALT